LYIDYPNLPSAVRVGGKVLLDDGAISLSVLQCNIEQGQVICVIDNTGSLRSRAGVNLPLANTNDLPALSTKDKADILYGMAHANIDYVAASFVQSADSVHQIRKHIQQCAHDLQWDPAMQPLPLLISKIETAGALQHFDAILAASDGIMVARGDLGVEIPLQQVINAQKEMIYACNAVGKVCDSTSACVCACVRACNVSTGSHRPAQSTFFSLSLLIMMCCVCFFLFQNFCCFSACHCGYANVGVNAKKSSTHSSRSF
jgi:pyruvate kinase